MKDNKDGIMVGALGVTAMYLLFNGLKSLDKKDYRNKIDLEKTYIPHTEELEKTLKADEYFG